MRAVFDGAVEYDRHTYIGVTLLNPRRRVKATEDDSAIHCDATHPMPQSAAFNTAGALVLKSDCFALPLEKPFAAPVAAPGDRSVGLPAF